MTDDDLNTLSTTDPYAFSLSYYPGDGAGSDSDGWVEEVAPDDYEGREKTRTGFKPDGTDCNGNPIYNPTIERDGETYSKWEYLYQLQMGREATDINRNSSNRPAVKRDAKTWMSQLEMSKYQREEVLNVLDSLDNLKFGGYTAETVVFATISLVANDDGWWIQQYDSLHQQQNSKQPPTTFDDQPLFKKMMSDCNVPLSRLNKMRRVLRKLDGVPL